MSQDRMHWLACRRQGVLLLVAAVLLRACNTVAQSPRPAALDNFAKCLAAKRAAMYGSLICPHCEDQRKLFGDSFRYVPYIECSRMASEKNAAACKAAQVRFTPTWVFANGDRLVGMQTLKDLSDKTGCPLR